MMYLNHKHKFIFIHVPKNGGSTIFKYFIENKIENSNPLADNSCWDHCPASYARGVIPDEFSTYYKFGIVRNPYDRFISAFFFREMFSIRKKIKYFRDRNCNLGYFNNLSIGETREHIKKLFIPEYLDKPSSYQNVPGSQYIDEITPQHVFLCDKKDIIVNEVFKAETLDSNIPGILQKLNISINTPPTKRNVGYKPPYDKSLLFDEELRERVYNFYKEDFEIFNYAK